MQDAKALTVRASVAGPWMVALALALAGCASKGPAPTPRVTSAAGEDLATSSDETPVMRQARTRYALAEEYLGQGKLETALDEVKQAVTLWPNFAQGHNLRGLIYAQMREFGLSDSAFQRALAIDPRNADVLHNYGWVLCRQSRFDEAQKRFQEALAVPTYRDRGKTLLVSGICHAQAKSWSAAEAALMQASELDPNNPIVAVNLAETLLRKGDPLRARPLIQRVLAVPQFVSPETLWLAIRVESRLGGGATVRELGAVLQQRFPQSAEAAKFEKGQFNE